MEKEVTAIVNARLTFVYTVKDKSEVKTAKDFNQDFQEAMEGKKPFIFDGMEAVSVKNFVMDLK